MDHEVLESCVAAVAGSDGRPTAEALYEAAKDPMHPLHQGYGFQWDLKKAADLHNLDVARRLIRGVKINFFVHSKRVVRAPAYVRDPTLPAGQQGYIAVSQLRTDKENARKAALAEIERVEAALRRAQKVVDALALGDEFDALLQQVAGVRLAIDRADEAA